MTKDLPTTETPSNAPARGRRRFYFVLAAMVVLFALVVSQRDRIRANWWAWRIQQTEDPVDQARLMELLSSTLPQGEHAVRSLLDADRPATRTLALVLAAKLPEPSAIGALSDAMHDMDRDVREAAALALAFMQTPGSREALVEFAKHGDRDDGSAAAYALSRDQSVETLCVLATAIRKHSLPAVRAQAVESLIDRISVMTAEQIQAMPNSSPCNVLELFVAAARDDTVFEAQLAIEREIDEARAFLRSRRPVDAELPPSHALTRRTIGELIRTMSAERLGVDLSGNSGASDAEIADRLRNELLNLASSRPGLPGDMSMPGIEEP